ncbi:hypothetical protein EN883_11220 [Mesorhizobium sp. M7A.F.Ca.AU.002.06.1.1]|nr:hypothetical protein EOC84_14860 [Mesorhizobium sp. Primo-B]RUU34058.1 hypothetical protein EOC83_30620 [Mesorhizobium sp. Primo-A]RUX14661.1 hypothetical protein EN996_15765 [Mesorhizobium sp. M7A.F.Ca.CA.002.14.1.2]RUX36839.1 hypothetical protein EN987_23120 [Mesorhizobium sp. M7A.F.Ca.CA.002.11.2.1]RUX47280.1 hypothetical protein EN994_22810 [Mesorhizobium sp. M7A.F.Ca.CA.002.09.1.1]RUX56392.1 hypothetical protein EN989_23215 [Mesorhizobium sp. M7A.F.Ca.CA.002.12.1.1]RUY47372.1 hypothet
MAPPSVLPDISPSKGGDWPLPGLPLICNAAEVGETPKLLISPLEGEMSGRTEGGAVPPAF